MLFDESFVRDRSFGAFIGLAIGDALGAATEFCQPGTFEPITTYRTGTWKLVPGQFTDDTSMAWALGDSLSEKGFDPDDQLRRYCEWYRTGKYSSNGRVFDIGNTTRDALDDYERSGRVRANPGENRQGNGSIMRLAPVVVWSVNRQHPWRETVELCGQSSMTTHSEKTCVDACRLLALKMVCAMLGWPVSVNHGGWLPALEPSIIKIADCDYCDFNFVPSNSGWVVDTLRTALWCFQTTQSFYDCVTRAANLGGDADTIAAVAGQMAGSYYGYKAMKSDPLSKSLVENLSRRADLEGVVTRLIDSA